MKLYEKIKNIFHNYRNIEENSIDYENAKTILKNDRNAILIDVRSPQEYKENHLNGSINLPLYDLERNCDKIKYNKEDTLIIYCQSGNRSKRALKILLDQGYTHLYEIKGGLDAIWCVGVPLGTFHLGTFFKNVPKWNVPKGTP